MAKRKYVPYNGRNIVHSLGTLHYRFNNSVCVVGGGGWCVRSCLRTVAPAWHSLLPAQSKLIPSEEMSNGNFDSLQFFPLNFDHR